MLLFIGFVLGAFIFEPFIINFVYFSNLDLFYDIILTKKNKKKLLLFLDKLSKEN